MAGLSLGVLQPELAMDVACPLHGAAAKALPATWPHRQHAWKRRCWAAWRASPQGLWQWVWPATLLHVQIPLSMLLPALTLTLTVTVVL